MKNKRIIILLVALIATAAAISCSSSAEKEMLTSKPDFIGFITEVNPNETGQGLARVTVESHADKLLHRYFVTLQVNTVLLRREAGTTTAAEASSLKPKDWVEIWFAKPAERPMAEVIARQIIITDRPSG
jgi:hypothetical protein